MKNQSTISLNLTFREDTPRYITDFFTKGIKHESVPNVLYDYDFRFDNKPNFSGKTTMLCEENNGQFHLYIYHKFDFDTEAAEGYWFTGGLAQYAEDDDMAGYIKHADKTVGTQIFGFRDKRIFWKNDLKIEIDSNRFRGNIRKITSTDYPFLEEFLYQAIYVPEGNPQPDKSIIFYPELYNYIKDFGKNNDLGFVVESEKNIIGAIWTRLFDENEKGYGFVDDKTPELSMAINPDFRSQGIGSKLMEKMMLKLQESGYQQVSLSVDNRNFAYQLYLKFGFEDVKIDNNSVTMIKVL